MFHTHGVRGFAFASVLLVWVVACGGSTTTSTESPEVTSPTTAAAVEPAADAGSGTDVVGDEADGRPVSSVTDVKEATVQVIAAGSFRDPLAGDISGWGTGSGFIIDPDGIVVTNNHVVTGAGLVKVRVGGSTDEIPARVLGVSECNDLAVLQLTDPGPYPYVDWYTGEIQPPLEVFTAGFPLGDPEFTITRGVVSKAEADGNTPWASVRRVIEHDANIQPGNSGGPLVTADGEVVAVNYAGGDPGTGTSQFFAIAADLAIPVVERLREGDEETIGINGEAVVSDDGSIVGVWVGAVQPGSPAANAGVLPGDIINRLNGVPMSPWTLQNYCDVLRSSSPGDAVSLQVIRFDTGEIWEGELNGTPMSARFSFADELADELSVEDSSDQPEVAYEFQQITDDTGLITVDVPVSWSDRDTSPTDLGLPSGPVPSIFAAPDLFAFLDAYTEPGMLFMGVPRGAVDIDTDALLDELTPPGGAACATFGRGTYEDPVFAGVVESWDCDGRALFVALSVKPLGNPDALVIVAIVAVTEADLDALDQILLTFDFN